MSGDISIGTSEMRASSGSETTSTSEVCAAAILSLTEAGIKARYTRGKANRDSYRSRLWSLALTKNAEAADNSATEFQFGGVLGHGQMVSHLSEAGDCFVFRKLKNALQCMELADK